MKRIMIVFIVLIFGAAQSCPAFASDPVVDNGFQSLVNSLAGVGIADDAFVIVDVDTLSLDNYCEVFGLFSSSVNSTSFVFNGDMEAMNDDSPTGGDPVDVFGDVLLSNAWVPPSSIMDLANAGFLDHAAGGIFTLVTDAIDDPDDVLPLGDDDDSPNLLVLEITQATQVSVNQFPGVVIENLVPGDLVLCYNDDGTPDFDYNDFIVVAKFCSGCRIDVKPFSCVNVVDPCTESTICVAILGGPGCDVKSIDTASISFGPGSAAPLEKTICADINGDGYQDLIVCFDLGETGLTPADTEACLTFTYGGRIMEMCDNIVILPVQSVMP